eukprot:4298469-Prymnesium_polylepis.1
MAPRALPRPLRKRSSRVPTCRCPCGRELTRGPERRRIMSKLPVNSIRAPPRHRQPLHRIHRTCH